MFTLETLQLFSQLLSTTTLNVGAEDFDEAAHAVLAARKELASAIAAHPESVQPNREQRRAAAKATAKTTKSK